MPVGLYQRAEIFNLETVVLKASIGIYNTDIVAVYKSNIFFSKSAEGHQIK